MAVVLVLVGTFVLIVVCSIVGARRGTPMAFEPRDANEIRAQAEAKKLNDGFGPML